MQGLGAPFLDRELQHAFLREVGADAHRRGLCAARLERREPRDIVARGQYPQVGAVALLEHLPDGHGLVEAVGAGLVGGDGQRCRQLDLLCGSSPCKKCSQRRGDRFERHLVFPLF